MDPSPFRQDTSGQRGRGEGVRASEFLCVCVRVCARVMASQIWDFITPRSQQPFALAPSPQGPPGTRRGRGERCSGLPPAAPGRAWSGRCVCVRGPGWRVAGLVSMQRRDARSAQAWMWGLARARASGRGEAGGGAGGAGTPGGVEPPSHRVSSACLCRPWTRTAAAGSARGRLPRSPVHRRADRSRRRRRRG